MATIELQTTAELAESRRKMQAKRRMKNRLALTLSMATMAFGLFWLVNTFIGYQSSLITDNMSAQTKKNPSIFILKIFIVS